MAATGVEETQKPEGTGLPEDFWSVHAKVKSTRTLSAKKKLLMRTLKLAIAQARADVEEEAQAAGVAGDQEMQTIQNNLIEGMEKQVVQIQNEVGKLEKFEPLIQLYEAVQPDMLSRSDPGEAENAQAENAKKIEERLKNLNCELLQKVHDLGLSALNGEDDLIEKLKVQVAVLENEVTGFLALVKTTVLPYEKMLKHLKDLIAPGAGVKKSRQDDRSDERQQEKKHKTGSPVDSCDGGEGGEGGASGGDNDVGAKDLVDYITRVPVPKELEDFLQVTPEPQWMATVKQDYHKVLNKHFGCDKTPEQWGKKLNLRFRREKGFSWMKSGAKFWIK